MTSERVVVYRLVHGVSTIYVHGVSWVLPGVGVEPDGVLSLRSLHRPGAPLVRVVVHVVADGSTAGSADATHLGSAWSMGSLWQVFLEETRAATSLPDGDHAAT